MKSNSYNIAFTVILLSFCSGCIRKVNCDSTKSKKLGTIEYSDKFKEFNIEDTKNTISFKSDSEELVFTRNTETTQNPKRYLDYKICESIDIKPSTAYAYYEYENLEGIFQTDSAILVITPDISKDINDREESLYLNFSKDGSIGVKARVPISNIDTTRTYQPFGELFKYHESINLGDKELEKVWSFKKEGTGIYYSKQLGIIALEANGKFYFRV